MFHNYFDDIMCTFYYLQMLWHLKCGNRLPIPEPKTCPLLVANIMKGCWNEDPAQRPNFGYISMQLSTKM